MKNDELHLGRFDENVLSYDTVKLEEEPEHNFGWHVNRFLGLFGIRVINHGMTIEEEIDDSDFDVCTTFLPDDAPDNNGEPELVEMRLFTKGNAIWQRTKHKRAITVALLVLCVLLVGVPLFEQVRNGLSTISFASPRATPTTTRITTVYTYTVDENSVVTNTNGTVTVDANTMPQYCPINITGERRLVGNYPIWLSDMHNTLTQNAMVHLPTTTLATIKQWKGWTVPLQLTGRIKYSSTISLSIADLYGTSSPLLHSPITGADSSRILFNMKQATVSPGKNGVSNLGTLDITVYLPRAGCYAISAYWQQGHWQMSFAAGK